MHKFFISLIFSCFFSTFVLGMTDMTEQTGYKDAGNIRASKDTGYWGDNDLEHYAYYATADYKDAPETKRIELPKKEVYWDDAKLRFFMRGDKEKYWAMFKQAVKEQNAVLQVALVNAYHASLKDKDADRVSDIFDAKQFNYFNDRDALTFKYETYKQLGQEAFNRSWRVDESFLRCISEKAYEKAAEEGFPRAIIVEAMTAFFQEKLEASQREKLRDLAEAKNLGAMYVYGMVLLWDNTIPQEQRDQGFTYMYNSGLCVELLEGMRGWDYFKSRTEAVPPGRSWNCYKEMKIFKETYQIMVPYEGYLEDVFFNFGAII